LKQGKKVKRNDWKRFTGTMGRQFLQIHPAFPGGNVLKEVYVIVDNVIDRIFEGRYHDFYADDWEVVE
jgi:hypothetical protein